MDTSPEAIAQWFMAQGFHATYQSAAVTLLVHPELPGLEARIGTVYAVIERDGREVFRSQLRAFTPELALARLQPG